MNWLEVFGWAGSVLVVVSLVVARATRFRLLNLLGCLIATAYNLVLGIWPYMAMNAVISVVDAYWLARLRREQRAGHDYRLLAVRPDDAYLNHLLHAHRDELAHYYPAFAVEELATADDDAPEAYLAIEGDQVAGIVLLRDGGPEAETRIEVDYALPGHRDMSLGRFLYTPDGLAGTRSRFRAPHGPCEQYFADLGFTANEDRLTLQVA